MGNINLTKILFACLIITFAATTLFGNYVEFVDLNNVSIDEPYSSAFQQIGGEYSSFETIGGTVGDESTVKNIFNAGQNLVTGTVNVFIVGLNALGAFFNMIPAIGNILSAITLGIPALSGLIGMITLMVGIYIAMSYIKSASNKTELP